MFGTGSQNRRLRRFIDLHVEKSGFGGPKPRYHNLTIGANRNISDGNRWLVPSLGLYPNAGNTLSASISRVGSNFMPSLVLEDMTSRPTPKLSYTWALCKISAGSAPIE